jgi:predicted secreted protein
MSGIETAVLFFLLWWVVLFTTLPFGVRRAENPEPGIDPGAPKNPRLMTKALVTTGIAGTLTVLIYFLLAAGMLPVREWLTS